MFLEKISIKKLRNIKEADLKLNHRTNVIIGENAAGKTTFLEAIDILSRGRSFRTNKIESLVQAGQTELYVGAISGPKRKKLEIKKSKYKTSVFVDSKEEKQQSKIAENLAVQAIHPNSHALIEGSPSERRAFLDWGLFHVEQNFKKEYAAYLKILKQRNEALKARKSDEKIWMEQLAPIGTKITKMREEYIYSLKDHLCIMQQHIMPDIDLVFRYDKGWGKDQDFLSALKEKNNIDLERGYTSCGPQNADIKIELNNKDAQKICSRGQQKLIANIMLLSQSRNFFERKGFPSIIIIDDLSAELTLEMQERVLERLFETKSQIFLSALNDSVLADILCEMDTNVFHVEHGEIMQ